MRNAAVIVVALASFGMARLGVRAPLTSHEKSRIVEVESSEYASLHASSHSVQPLTTPKTYPGKATAS